MLLMLFFDIRTHVFFMSAGSLPCVETSCEMCTFGEEVVKNDFIVIVLRILRGRKLQKKSAIGFGSSRD